MENIERILERQSEEIEKKFQRHTGILLEQFEDQVKVVAEGFEMFSDKIGRVETRLSGVEINIEIIKTDTEFIKNGLKKKIDLEEFAALERRVALLEAHAK